MTIFAKCTGGLANRVLPFMTYAEIQKRTGAPVHLVWKSSRSCEAAFSDLFHEDFPLAECVPANAVHYGIPPRCPEFPPFSIERLMEDHRSGRDVCLHATLPSQHLYDPQVIRDLRPLPKIQRSIQAWQAKLNLTKETIGIHARCSDMASVHFYLRRMREVPTDRRIFLTSDEKGVESRFQRELGERLISRPKNHYVQKLVESNRNWESNVVRSKESVQEALVDLYLIAQTDLRIYSPRSTFSAWALILGAEEPMTDLEIFTSRGIKTA